MINYSGKFDFVFIFNNVFFHIFNEIYPYNLQVKTFNEKNFGIRNDAIDGVVLCSLIFSFEVSNKVASQFRLSRAANDANLTSKNRRLHSIHKMCRNSDALEFLLIFFVNFS